MARLDARWLNFWQRGETWYHFWQDYPFYGPISYLDVTLAAATLSATGTITWPERLGTLTQTLAVVTSVSDTDVAISSSLTQTLGAATLTSLAEIVWPERIGQLNVSLGAVTVVSTGTITWPLRSGLLDVSLETLAADGAGGVELSSSLSITLETTQLNSTGLIPIEETFPAEALTVKFSSQKAKKANQEAFEKYKKDYERNYEMRLSEKLAKDLAEQRMINLENQAQLEQMKERARQVERDVEKQRSVVTSIVEQMGSALATLPITQPVMEVEHKIVPPAPTLLELRRMESRLNSLELARAARMKNLKKAKKGG